MKPRATRAQLRAPRGRLIDQASKRQMRLEEGLVWRYAGQICGALRYMHERRVMHRDVKPANVFVTAAWSDGAEGADASDGVGTSVPPNAHVPRDHCMKLGDLGLGRYFSSQTHEVHSNVGTPYYMSPECMQAILIVSDRSPR